MSNSWEGLDGPDYEIIDLGRPTVFFIPIRKLKKKFEGLFIEDWLQSLVEGSTPLLVKAKGSLAGVWKNEHGKVFYDHCKKFEVPIKEPRILLFLFEKLGHLARAIDEEAIYFRVGQHSGLLKPKRKRRKR